MWSESTFKTNERGTMMGMDFDYEREFSELSEDVSFEGQQIISSLISGSTDWTTDTIVRQVEKKNIQLDPEFQRRDAWSIARKSEFIESLALGFPIPQIVLAENKKKKGTFIVIDGKQRLLSLMQFFNIPGYKNIKIKNLKILTALNNKSIDDIKGDLNISGFIDNIENSTIRTVVIRNWDSESVLYQIFLRLNSNSVRLSPQELRGALHPGKFVSYVNEFTATNTNLKRIFKSKSEPDFRMRDVELFIRFVGYKLFISDYKGNLKQFLDDTCKKLNNNWDNFSQTISDISQEFDLACDTTFTIFGDDAFHKFLPNKGYESNFNRAVFDVMAYYFSQKNISNASITNISNVKKTYEELCSNNPDFVNSIETTTKSIESTQTRLKEWGNALGNILDTDISIPQVG